MNLKVRVKILYCLSCYNTPSEYHRQVRYIVTLDIRSWNDTVKGCAVDARLFHLAKGYAVATRLQEIIHL